MTEQESYCPICGGVLFGLHCKLTCRNCGYREDCSDLFPPGDAKPASGSAKPPVPAPQDDLTA